MNAKINDSKISKAKMSIIFVLGSVPYLKK